MVKLAQDIGIRNYTIPQNLEAAAIYIENVLQQTGFPVSRNEFTAHFDGRTYANIEAVLEGSEKEAPVLVIGAHYDSVQCPGANDNASGVAALLEIAKMFADTAPPRKTIRFVAFANEEPPFFGGPDMGSAVYARSLVRKNIPLMGMICLESIGCYHTKPDSQQIPEYLQPFYYNRIGNFVAICGDSASKDFTELVLKAFRNCSNFPSEGLAGPASGLPFISMSDDKCFWEVGFKALMVTDTVFMRQPNHYHLTTDTPDTLNYSAFARVNMWTDGCYIGRFA